VNTTIESPNWPDPYPARADCRWTVRAPTGHFVEAFVDHLWFTASENCSQVLRCFSFKI
jgi:hypothetical protein